VKNPDTIALAIRIGNPARWSEAVKALEESKGLTVGVTDRRIMESWRMLAELEGLFVEPSTAAGLAALIQEIELEIINPVKKKIVVVLTGHGLKDPSTAIAQAVDPIELPASQEAVEAHLES
jgi:threonine synthase